MTTISLDHAQRELARAIRAWQFDPDNVDLEKDVIYWREEVRRLHIKQRMPFSDDTIRGHSDPDQVINF